MFVRLSVRRGKWDATSNTTRNSNERCWRWSWKEVAAWKLAVGQYGAPQLHHSDQGSQYTSHDYLRLLEQDHVLLSMSDVGQCHAGEFLEHVENRVC